MRGQADIDYIELCLGYALPADYRRFLLQHAGEVRRLKEQLPRGAVPRTAPDGIIRGNTQARRLAAQMPGGENRLPWPENYLVVGTNGGRDYWFVHRDESESGLWF